MNKRIAKKGFLGKGSAGKGFLGREITRRNFLKYIAAGLAAAAVHTPLPFLEHKKHSKRLRLMAVGDIMAHNSILNAAYNPYTKSFDFNPLLADTKPVFHEADFVIGNLETRLAGEGEVNVAGRSVRGYTSYPLVNSPEQLAYDLKNAGFSLLITANNHALDRAEEGIIKTNENIEKAGLIQTGTFSNWEDHDKVRILEKNGIRLAVFAYTYGTNGISISKNKEYLVNLIDFQKIKKDFASARKENADLIVCSLHFGNEYWRTPSKEQEITADKVYDLGADIILGSHPHVVQPYVMKKNGVIAYSLGNFISGQARKYTDLGMIFQVDIKKECCPEITEVKALPTEVFRENAYGKTSTRVLPLERMLKLGEFSGDVRKQLLADFAEMKKHINSIG